jgi:hypothetical protein
MKEMALNFRSEKLIDTISGYDVELHPAYLLNGNLVVSIEATKKQLFGSYIKSIKGGFKVSPDGMFTIHETPVVSWESTRQRNHWEKLRTYYQCA